MKPLAELLAASAALHRHLCPRQVLGVRMGLYGARLLDLDVPQEDKRLLAIVETDGCAADGVAVATGCWVGRRTLRVEDLGKVAATFVDTVSGAAVRLVPRPDVRARARDLATEARGKWEAQLLGYQRMPDDDLFAWQWVTLNTPIRAIVSRPGARATCEACGEEIINERETFHRNMTLCRACAHGAYYAPLAVPLPSPVFADLPSLGGIRQGATAA